MRKAFSKLKRQFFKNIFLVKYGALAVMTVGFIYFVSAFALPFANLANHLPVNFSSKSLNSDAGRINVLVLGIGGENHDGPDLTDTMMVISLPITPGPVYFVSVPRDIYLDYLGDKINSAYMTGRFLLAKATVTHVTGLPLHYAVRIDFSSFAQIIDLLGGVDIEVENAFTDEQYPVVGKETDPCEECRFEVLRFEKGLTHMDGSLALKYVRSRYSTDPVEGTDFARSKRQQKLITAVKQKVLFLPNMLNFNKGLEIYNTLRSHIDTDIPDNELNSFFKLALKLKDAAFKNIILDESLLINPPIDYRGWILLPKDGSFEEIHRFLKEAIWPTGVTPLPQP
ncbi:MAG: LCP family protein [bacterium]|nr:LCP family protein [bacterium]